MKIVSDQFTNHIKTADGIVTVPPGQVFECKDEIAREKIDAGRARPAVASSASDLEASATAPAPSEGSDDERREKIEEAMLELDESDKSLFMKDGKPKADVLSKKLGFGVTSEERDAIWASLQS